MCFAVSFTLGFYTKVFGLLTWIALVSIWHHDPLLLDADDAILRVSVLYLIFSPSGNAFSIDKCRNQMLPKQASVWPLRLLQFQLVIIYFASGWFKLQNPLWMNGTLLKSILMHPQYSRWDLGSFFNQSWLGEFIEPLSNFICWWEMLFPLLLCQRFTRRACIAVGIIFHLGLLIMMHLRWFPIIMLVLYLVFLPKNWQNIFKKRSKLIFDLKR